MQSKRVGNGAALVSKKVGVPALPRDAEFRPRLKRQMQECAKHPVTIVQAPAGYGKSYLASSWARQIKGACAWVSLDEGDSELGNFWSSVLHAYMHMGLSVDDIAESVNGLAAQSNIHRVLDYLSGILQRQGTESTLILEDYHALDKDSPVHQTLTYFMSHLPEDTRLVITSRTYPSLGLLKLKSRGLLGELGAQDLRFTHDEIVEYFDSRKLSLTPHEADHLAQYTEGWPVAIKLMALSRATPMPALAPESFAQTKSLASSYLFTEVLSALPADVLLFLETTCCVEEFSRPLAAYLLRNTSCAIDTCIEYLRERSLFITSTVRATHDTWYRYHPLFSEGVLHHLQSNARQSIDMVLGDALTWYEEQGLDEEVVRLASVLGNYEAIQRTILKRFNAPNGADSFIIMLRWLELLPQDYIRQSPELCATGSILWAMVGQTERAFKELDYAKDALTSCQDERYGLWLSAKAYIACMIGNDSEVVTYAQEALRYLGEESNYLKGLVSQLLAGALGVSEPEKAIDIFHQLLYEQPSSSNINLMHAAHACLCLLNAAIGDYERAYEWVDITLEPFDNEAHHPLQPMLSYCYAARALSWYKQARYGGVDYQADYALEHAYDNWNPVLYAQVYSVKASLAFFRGEQALAEELAQKSLEISPSGFARNYPSLAALKVWQEAAVLGRESFLLANEETPDHVIWVRAALNFVRGDLTDHEYLVAHEATLPPKRLLATIAFNLLIALEAEALGRQDEADRAFAKAFTLIEATGAKQIVLENNGFLAPLLKRFTLETKRLYASKLLSAIKKMQAVGNPLLPIEAELTARESEIISFVARGLSTKEIAAELVLSPQTVKKHVANVCAKLGVHSRMQAVAKLKEEEAGQSCAAKSYR